MPGKSICQKLQIKEGYRVLLFNPLGGYEKEILSKLPKNTFVLRQLSGQLDLVQAIISLRKELERQVAYFG